MGKKEGTSFYEDLSRITTDSDQTRKSELDWLRKNGDIVGADPHPHSGGAQHEEPINFDQPHGKLRDWIRQLLRGKGGF